jgi:hypothetical protein
MSLDIMSVDKMSSDKMSSDKMACYQASRLCWWVSKSWKKLSWKGFRAKKTWILSSTIKNVKKDKKTFAKFN